MLNDVLHLPGDGEYLAHERAIELLSFYDVAEGGHSPIRDALCAMAGPLYGTVPTGVRQAGKGQRRTQLPSSER